ncbi:MAG: FkbM family methyltransferase [Deltaproteobacteria bacterium]|nr:FkbM family methyltransferase [Deltaproteobacteria bacterium]
MSLAELLAIASYDTLRSGWLARYHAAAVPAAGRIAVVGAAGWIAPLVQAAAARGVEIGGIFDESPAREGASLAGHVIRPLAAMQALDRATPIALGTHHYGPLATRLRVQGFQHCLPYALFHEADPQWPAHPFYAGLLADLWAHRDRYAALAQVLADDASRATLDAVLAFRMTLEPERLAGCCRPDAYFAELTSGGERDVFIDGGAYTGDTFARFGAWSGHRYRAALLFEPDPDNFAQLQVATQGDARVRCVSSALAARAGEAQFVRDAGRTAHLAAHGGTPVRTVALDDSPAAADATLIKLNIEGAELEALQGAAALIRRQRPQLAIAVYHRPAHLWQLMEYLQSLGVGYRFLLRQHAEALVETVLYAAAQ